MVEHNILPGADLPLALEKKRKKKAKKKKASCLTKREGRNITWKSIYLSEH